MEQQGQAEWIDKGRITVECDRIVLPELPPDPGLYRLQFDTDTLYFGEANDIQRRIGDYVVYYRSVGIESELRIHTALKKFNGADVAVLVGREYEDHSSRCVREHREIREARAAGKKVLNGGTLDERIAFHEGEAARLRAKRAIQTGLDGAAHGQ